MEFKELFEPVIKFIKGLQNKEKENSKDEAKKRLQLVLMQDRASVSPDFFEMMKKEIIEVIKKYIEIDEEALEVQLTRGFEDGLEGPALYANIPIKNIKPVAKKVEKKADEVEVEEKVEENFQEKAEIAPEDENGEQESTEKEVAVEETVKEAEEAKAEVEGSANNESEDNKEKDEAQKEVPQQKEVKKTTNGSKKKNSNTKKKTTNTKK